MANTIYQETLGSTGMRVVKDQNMMKLSLLDLCGDPKTIEESQSIVLLDTCMFPLYEEYAKRLDSVFSLNQDVVASAAFVLIQFEAILYKPNVFLPLAVHDQLSLRQGRCAQYVAKQCKSIRDHLTRIRRPKALIPFKEDIISDLETIAQVRDRILRSNDAVFNIEDTSLYDLLFNTVCTVEDYGKCKRDTLGDQRADEKIVANVIYASIKHQKSVTVLTYDRDIKNLIQTTIMALTASNIVGENSILMDYWMNYPIMLASNVDPLDQSPKGRYEVNQPFEVYFKTDNCLGRIIAAPGITQDEAVKLKIIEAARLLAGYIPTKVQAAIDKTPSTSQERKAPLLDTGSELTTAVHNALWTIFNGDPVRNAHPVRLDELKTVRSRLKQYQTVAEYIGCTGLSTTITEQDAPLAHVQSGIETKLSAAQEALRVFTERVNELKEDPEQLRELSESDILQTLRYSFGQARLKVPGGYTQTPGSEGPHTPNALPPPDDPSLLDKCLRYDGAIVEVLKRGPVRLRNVQKIVMQTHPQVDKAYVWSRLRAMVDQGVAEKIETGVYKLRAKTEENSPNQYAGQTKEYPGHSLKELNLRELSSYTGIEYQKLAKRVRQLEEEGKLKCTKGPGHSKLLPPTARVIKLLRQED